MEVTRIFDLLPHYAEKFKPKDDVIASKENGQWKKYSIKDYIRIVNEISYGFLALGVAPGDRIAQISANRAEWNFIDMAILQIGAVHVPIYPTISESDYKFILNHAEVKYVFVSGWDLLRKIDHILPEVPSIKDVYTYSDTEGKKHLSELVELGKKNVQAEKLDTIKNTITPDTLATIIYTSGTTGQPKGVMLSHNNLVSNFIACSVIPPFGEEGRAISYLPLCHVYERMLNYMYQYIGISIYYAENLGTIAENIKETNADMLTTVPRLLEKIYDKIISKGLKLKGIKRIIFFWAVNLGKRYKFNDNSWWYLLKLSIADKLVFSKWREALGGRMRLIVSGGAALQPRLCTIFWAAGIQVMEGYGLTETSPVIAVSHYGKNGIKFGTVGPPLQGVEVRIADDGEILSRGPNTMIGYYKDEELTREVIDADGWCHTGDIGVIEPEGQLRITGRKKEIFKTSFGKYVSPQPIENKFKESSFIENIIVVGENQKFAAALIVPDFIMLKSYCEEKGIGYTSQEEVILDKRIIKVFQKEMNTYNAFFGETEKIKRFELMPVEWSVETGELTPTLKLKRKFICEKYKGIIDKLFDLA